jgi:BirA family biotin operon repressor/biotin-[acetyl-CoA-carboxylase] ligase
MLSNNWLIQKLNVVDSTQNYARQFMNNNSQVLILADEQTNGYGQENRQWESLKGNLHASLIIPNIKPISNLTYVIGISIGNTINSFSRDIEIQYKWVNDVLINDKKVAGILTEQINDKLIIGIGLNLISHPDTAKTSITGATSLLENGLQITSEEFIEKFLIVFTDLYNQWVENGFENFRKLWIAKAFKINQLVSIQSGDDIVSGILSDLDSIDGSIIIQSSNNQLTKLQVGRLI